MSSSKRLLINLPLILAVFLQAALWMHSRHIKPDLGILPEVPGSYEVKALSLGDDEFYFRLLGLRLQMAGDTFGRSTPLKDYDYEKLAQWFRILDSLDDKSNYIPSLAAYYFSLTQRHSDTIYVINYLQENAARDPERKWWWLVQASIIAKYKLHDKEMALKIAEKLGDIHGDIPIWARQLPAFYLADMGEKEQAVIIIRDLLKNYKNLPSDELNFMYYFVKDRLKMIVPQELQDAHEVE
jgi:tetratricopeptide (TPR) repeat protein